MNIQNIVVKKNTEDKSVWKVQNIVDKENNYTKYSGMRETKSN